MIFLPIVVFLLAVRGNANELQSTNKTEALLGVTVSTTDGSYAIKADGLAEPVLQAQFAIEVDHRWVESRDYPKHVAVSTGRCNTGLEFTRRSFEPKVFRRRLFKRSATLSRSD